MWSLHKYVLRCTIRAKNGIFGAICHYFLRHSFVPQLLPGSLGASQSGELAVSPTERQMYIWSAPSPKVTRVIMLHQEIVVSHEEFESCSRARRFFLSLDLTIPSFKQRGMLLTHWRGFPLETATRLAQYSRQYSKSLGFRR